MPAADDLTGGNPPVNRIGHQGLFFERFCAAVGESVGDATLTPTATAGVYYNRNRIYEPHLGRFIQRDPNATAMPILAALASNGETIEILVDAFEPQDHYGDGLNLYEYLGSNPVNRLDALGLGWNDMFDEIDDIIMQMAGERAAAAHHAMSMMGKMAQTAATFAVQTALAALFPPYGAYLSLQGAAMAIEDMMYSGVSLENTALLGLSVFGIGATAGPAVAQGQWMLGKLAGGMRAGYGAVGRRYAASGAARSGFNRSGAPGAVGRLTGQMHHAISKKIWVALEDNAGTVGKFTYRDPRFVTQAKDAASHRGYQTWHRQLDEEIVGWIESHSPSATQFESHLRAKYLQPKMLERFPNGL